MRPQANNSSLLLRYILYFSFLCFDTLLLGYILPLPKSCSVLRIYLSIPHHKESVTVPSVFPGTVALTFNLMLAFILAIISNGYHPDPLFMCLHRDVY